MRTGKGSKTMMMAEAITQKLNPTTKLDLELSSYVTTWLRASHIECGRARIYA